MDRLLDTNAFSDLMREHPQVVARLAAVLPLDIVMICPIVRGEILHGIGRMQESKRKRALAARAEALFETIPCVPLPESARPLCERKSGCRSLLGSMATD
jgi:predicted nucleic acid-binding protein